MGILQRFLAGPAIGRGTERVVQALNQERQLRIPLYLDQELLASVFTQRLESTTQVLATTGLTLDFSGSTPMLSAKGSANQAVARTIEITALDQALLLEDAERDRGTLIDLRRAHPMPSALLHYVGRGHIFGPWESISKRNTPPRLSTREAASLQSLREEREMRFRSSEDVRGTMVWFTRAADRLASVTVPRQPYARTLASSTEPPFGMLGLFSESTPDLTLVTPLMLWRAAFTPRDTVRATLSRLGVTTVRVDVEVPASEVQHSVEDVAFKLGRVMRIPGYREGGVPPRLVVERLGWDVVVDDAVRQSLAAWVREAVTIVDLDISDPTTLDVGALPRPGQPLQFSFETSVRLQD